MKSASATKQSGTSVGGKAVKVDMKKDLKQYYQPSAKTVSLVEVPELKFLMLDGSGYPSDESTQFQQAIETLYGMAYTLKFMLKSEGQKPDFTVMPLEGLWWMKGGKKFDQANKDEWLWTLMIAVPDFVEAADVKRAMKMLEQKKNPPALSKVEFRSVAEGQAVQIMHIGPYSQEGPTIEKLHAFARENGLKLRGKHHEIYMGDPRRTAPEKLKTVVRQPVSQK
jgi:hypothetical protein